MGRDQINPILSVSIAVSAEDCAHIERTLKKLAQEDPALRVRLDRRGGKLVLSGEDELELEAACEKISQLTTAKIGGLQIAYRETVRKTAEAEGKYIRQTGGSGNYGHCWLRVEPNEPGKGYEFINDIKGGLVPKEYTKPIDEGVQGAMELGILAGFPMVDIKVTLFDGSYHDVDSNEMAFKLAASIGFKEAAKKASPMLLEPMMVVEATVPEEFMGAIIGDINARRGRIVDMNLQVPDTVVSAIVPLAEVLRSSARGRPPFAMRFARYEAASRKDGFGGDDFPAFAKKPKGPKSGNSSACAKPEF